MTPKCSAAEFITLFETMGATAMGEHLGMSERTVYLRRRRIENQIGRVLIPPRERQRRMVVDHPGKIDLQIRDGVALIGSDAHYWPGEPSTAHKAFVKFCKDFRPKAVILNGDVLDGATISRYPPMNWNTLPTLKQELDAVKDRLGEITVAAGKTRRIWTLGNHCARFESRLASVASQFADVDGTSLHHHFPDWEPGWMVEINDDVVVKHRFKGGIHATHNNTLWAGKTIITGHLHSLKVAPHSDYRDRVRFGVDSGTLADPYGPQFEYTELNPVSWRSGFIVLTFSSGELLWPEIVFVRDKGEVEFRGKLIRV